MDLAKLAPGAIIDGFRLEEPLKPGGMANLWRVTRAGDAASAENADAFPMIMKIPFTRGGESPVNIVGFEVEGMILPRLSGTHVPRFVAAGDFSNPYIVMELIAGQSLKVRLDDTPLPATEVAEIGAQIAVALHDLHRQHVIHLDLKPSNVIIRPNGEAALIDFGLSRHEQLPDLVDEEIDGPVGTGPYVAPEQILGVRSDPRSDLFALGVILYFLVTGERPFGDPQTVGEWRRRLWRDPLPPRARNKDVPPFLQEIILRCLEVDPGARPQTAADLAFALRNPECVLLSARAQRTQRDGFLKVLARRLRSGKNAATSAFPAPQRSVASQLARAPIIMAAVDVAPGHEGLSDAVARTVARLIDTQPGARLACVNVLKGSLLAIDPTEDAEGRSLHLKRLIELKHWARGFALPPERITFHAIEAMDAAAALIDFARTNRADHIVIGARASSALRRYLGSVSAQVVAEAPCTVTVVRVAA
jgi:nucleotide-binding universal stress UspA family protein